jgi:hypothetical protein
VADDPIPDRHSWAHDIFELSHGWRFGVHGHAGSLTEGANRACLHRGGTTPRKRHVEGERKTMPVGPRRAEVRPPGRPLRLYSEWPIGIFELSEVIIWIQLCEGHARALTQGTTGPEGQFERPFHFQDKTDSAAFHKHKIG